MDRNAKRINVAIACQGGGSHTAFTAGALGELLRRYRTEGPDCRFRIVALSGTSGGAVSAALAWRDLVLADRPAKGPTTVEKFWTEPYPDGNAAWPFPECLWLDWQDFALQNTLPWLRTADQLRNSAAQLGSKALESAFARTPMHAVLELQPFHFAQLFEAMDATPAGSAANEVFDLAGRQLRAFRDTSLPGSRRVTNLIGDMLDLLPWHAQSVVREGEPALIRREFDVQDAFRAVLARYFDEQCLKKLANALETHGGDAGRVPELLIGAADAQRVRDVRDEQARAAAARVEPEPAIARAKAKALALEEHEHHRASFSNLRVFRATEHLDRLVDSILASAAIPTLMRGVHFDGTTLWDGLYATNPPIYDLPDVHRVRGRAADDPDEIWVIRINPTQLGDRPDTAAEIADRRNELAGNLPLTQEIRNVIQIGGARKGDRYYKPITFGFIDMSEEVADRLDLPSKFNKDLRQIRTLFDDGVRQMDRFYERWLVATERQAEADAEFVYREDYSREIRVRAIDMNEGV